VFGRVWTCLDVVDQPPRRRNMQASPVHLDQCVKRARLTTMATLTTTDQTDMPTMPTTTSLAGLTAKLKATYPHDIIMCDKILARVDIAEQYQMPDWSNWPDLQALPSCDWHVFTYDQQVEWLMQFVHVAPDEVDNQLLNVGLKYGGYDCVWCRKCREEVVDYQYCCLCECNFCNKCVTDMAPATTTTLTTPTKLPDTPDCKHIWEHRCVADLRICDVCKSETWNKQFVYSTVIDHQQKHKTQQIDICTDCQDKPAALQLIQQHNMTALPIPIQLSKHDFHDRFGSLLDWIPVCKAKLSQPRVCDQCYTCNKCDQSGQSNNKSSILLLNINASAALFGQCSIWLVDHDRNYTSINLLNNNLQNIVASMTKQYKQYQLYVQLAQQMQQPDHLVRTYYADMV
jgi:hypothetical protein